jgi:MFS family permease
MRISDTVNGKAINWKEFAPAFVLVVNSLVWYTLTYVVFSSKLESLEFPIEEKFAVYGVYYAGIAISAIIGSSVFPRSRRKGLIIWMALGTLLSILMGTITSNSFPINMIVAAIIGITIGIGLPSTLAYFADSINIAKRGIHGGIAWLVVGIGGLSIAPIIATQQINVGSYVLAGWRIIGLVLFVLLTRKYDQSKKSAPADGFIQILSRREFLLYLAPWIMFSVINFVEFPILSNMFGSLAALLGFVELAISGVFALIGGILADRVGRKRVIITGFIIMGIEYALLSISGFFGSSVNIMGYLYVCLDGVAWGMFASVFFMIVWGDLAGEVMKEKYYAIGGLPYLLAGFLSILVQPSVSVALNETDYGMSFTLASFFLFIAVLPLIYAPETLPEKIMKENDLKKYVEKALEKVQKKSVGKGGDNKTPNDDKSEEPKDESNKFDEEAKKLADKYY